MKNMKKYDYEHLKNELKEYSIEVGKLYESSTAVTVFSMNSIEYYQSIDMEDRTRYVDRNDIFVLLDVFDIEDLLCSKETFKRHKLKQKISLIEFKILYKNNIFFMPAEYDSPEKRKDILKYFKGHFAKIN